MQALSSDSGTIFHEFYLPGTAGPYRIMDLRSGIPFWLATNGLLADYPSLDHNLDQEEIVIIGSGISGALAAHELCTAGFKCTMIDKRMLSSGSTWASTAQINYEIDIMLGDLAKKYDKAFAVAAYEASFDSVQRLQQVFKETGVDADVEQKRCLYVASDRKGEKEIEAEIKIRNRNSFPADYVDHETLVNDYLLDKRGALTHNHAAQLDSYKAAAGLITFHQQQGNLTVYTRTAISKLQPDKDGVTLLTDNGHTIRARYVVCAPGYEAGNFIPQGLKFFLYSTYALVTQPIDEKLFWKDRCQMWETARPYFYLRTTKDNRIMMGGQDSVFKSPLARDTMMDKKCGRILDQFRALYPHINVEPDFTWCGTFSFTPDGLPYIGLHPKLDRVYFALGYGGNGTTFSMIAAEVIKNTLLGRPDHRQRLFGFER
jgi:glycine/D-amino acid oxidase-like deaminating enzyme